MLFPFVEVVFVMFTKLQVLTNPHLH